MTPIPESQEVLQREGVPDNIKSFYKVNHIWKFRYDRPFHKGTKDKENEFKVLCRSRYGLGAPRGKTLAKWSLRVEGQPAILWSGGSQTPLGSRATWGAL